MSITERPNAVTGGRHTKDDGLFGPDSMTWRLHSEPTMLIIGTAAATTQMLLPRVMHMIDQASSFRTHPELRAKRTGEYILTITYGDVETAENAAASLGRLHERVRATDPKTGEEYNAKVPELLLWVHCTMVWATIVAADTYGPALTPAERDQYVTEQLIAARLIGCDPLDEVPDNFADIDAYVRGMLPQLGFTHDAVWFRDMVIPSGFPIGAEKTAGFVLNRAAVALMLPEHRELYGIKWPGWQDALARAGADALFKGIRSKMPFDALYSNLREQVDLNAFGARNAKV